MSAASTFAVFLASVPLTFGATRGLHERWRARWRLRDYPDLDDARENGRVSATGVVRALDETLTAPLSGRPCVAYRTRVWSSSQPTGVGYAYRETIQLRPFVIDLGDEEIIIDGERAMFGIPPQKLPRDPEREASFLARHALAHGRARFSEVVLELGAHVTVGGTLVLVPRDEPAMEELGFRDPPPPSQRIVGNRERPLLLVALDDRS